MIRDRRRSEGRHNVAVIGQTVLHYQIVEQLGSGGMGVVYPAEDAKLKRDVALKFLNASSLADTDVKGRFLREARAAAAIDHPNIFGVVHEIGEEAGRLFMAMPLLEGLSLYKRITEGPRPIEDILNISIQTAEGLEEADSKNIVHRDIKPANIMVSERGASLLQATLMDFGLALLSQATKLTREGSQLGMAACMSPEQTQGTEVDQMTDVWALGVVMYEMLAGQLPFKAEYEQALFYGILNEDPDAVTALRSGVPMELERIVHKCLTKQADERYQSIGVQLVEHVLLDQSKGCSTNAFPLFSNNDSPQLDSTVRSF